MHFGHVRLHNLLSAVAARKIGINEQRVFELRQIRDANPSLYQDVKAGRRSLNGALAEIGLPRETRFLKSDLGESVAASQELDRSAQHEMRELAQPTGGKAARRARKPASNEAAAAVKLPLSPAATEKALARIKAVLGSWFYAEVKARNLIQKPEEIIQFAKFTDAQMLKIGPLLKRGWTFVNASYSKCQSAAFCCSIVAPQLNASLLMWHLFSGE